MFRLHPITGSSLVFTFTTRTYSLYILLYTHTPVHSATMVMQKKKRRRRRGCCSCTCIAKPVKSWHTIVRSSRDESLEQWQKAASFDLHCNKFSEHQRCPITLGWSHLVFDERCRGFHVEILGLRLCAAWCMGSAF